MNDPVLDLFDKTGAYLKGHFRLTSGLHSPEYLQCARVLQHPEHAARLGHDLASAVKDLLNQEYGTPKVDVVVSPAMGGLIIGHEVARTLGVRHIFTERDQDRKMTLRRGFDVDTRRDRGGGGRRGHHRGQYLRSGLAAAGTGRSGARGLLHYRPKRRPGRRQCAQNRAGDTSSSFLHRGQMSFVQAGVPAGKAWLPPHLMRHIRITVCYDGTGFHGWQVQPEVATIQGTIESVLQEIEGKPVKVNGSGRTDAGVHALEQVAAFTLENPIPRGRICGRP